MKPSAYGNPAPYSNVTLEHRNLEGRLNVQRQCLATARRAGRTGDEARALYIINELLDHLLHVEERAASALVERDELDPVGYAQTRGYKIDPACEVCGTRTPPGVFACSPSCIDAWHRDRVLGAEPDGGAASS